MAAGTAARQCAPAGGRTLRQHGALRSIAHTPQPLAATVVRRLQRRACDGHQAAGSKTCRGKNFRLPFTGRQFFCVRAELRAKRRQTEATTTEMDLLLSVFYRGEEIHYSCCWVSWLGRLVGKEAGTTTEMDLLLSVFYRGVEVHYSCCWVSWLGR